MKKQVMFARMRESYSPGFFPFILQPGELLPIDLDGSVLSKHHEFNLMKRDIFGITSFAVPKNLCTCVFKVLESKFNVGDLVAKISTGHVFRIYSVKWDRVDFWFQNGWGESQGFANGALEADCRIATEEEITRDQAYIGYYDELMKKRETLGNTVTLDSKVNE
jgi:hypothetical protein